MTRTKLDVLTTTEAPEICAIVATIAWKAAW